MRRDTRQAILQAARELFNRHGYDGVSVRDIARAAGISKGNLTYHFSRKEDIVAALLESDSAPLPPAAPGTSRELDTMFTDMQKTVEAQSYFFLHHAQLSQISETIFHTQSRRYRAMLAHLQEAFCRLRSNGFFRPELFSGEYDRLINGLYMQAVYWAPFERLQKSVSRRPDFRRQVWGTLYHLLTDKGRAELGQILALD